MGTAIIVYHAVCQAEFDWMPRNSKAPYLSTKGQMRASKLYTWLAKIVVLMIYFYAVIQRQLNYEIQRILIFDVNTPLIWSSVHTKNYLLLSMTYRRAVGLVQSAWQCFVWPCQKDYDSQTDLYWSANRENQAGGHHLQYSFST